MQAPDGYKIVETLRGIPADEGVTHVLLKSADADDSTTDAFVLKVGPDDASHVVAFVDGAVGAAYRCDDAALATLNPRDAGEEPLVKLVGDIADKTGQLVIKQPEGHWRRYSRWDRLPKGPATQPNAIVRTLPQCGCGGYLGAPMMFDSFVEMVAYFFVVFSDAERVNAKHAAILTGDDTCCAI